MGAVSEDLARDLARVDQHARRTHPSSSRLRGCMTASYRFHISSARCWYSAAIALRTRSMNAPKATTAHS